MDKKITSIFAYLSWVGFLIAYLVGDKEGAKFHLNQGAVLAIISIVANVVSGISFLIPFGEFLLGIVNLAWLVLTVIGIVYAAQDMDKPLPLIGGVTILK